MNVNTFMLNAIFENCFDSDDLVKVTDEILKDSGYSDNDIKRAKYHGKHENEVMVEIYYDAEGSSGEEYEEAGMVYISVNEDGELRAEF